VSEAARLRPGYKSKKRAIPRMTPSDTGQTAESGKRKAASAAGKGGLAPTADIDRALHLISANSNPLI
jgi:hypothetical protein